jgi:hypothetical protein
VNLPSTWASRDLPILVSALRRIDAGEQHSVSQLEEIRQELGFTPQVLLAGLEALGSADPPYLEFEVAGGWTDERAGGGFVTRVSERARRELGAWPSPDDVISQLIRALVEAADAEPEAERKGRLRQAADVLAGMGRDVAVAVISARLGTLGLP